jgi:ABC-type polysaccharide/polyol phosphate export permease
MARSAVLAGRTLADLVRSTAILLLQLGVGIVLGFRWQAGLAGLLVAIGPALAFGYACSWVMATLGLAVRNTEAIQAATYMVFPLTLVSSVFLPTRTMPGWLQAFAAHQPVTTVANAVRVLTLGDAALPPEQTTAGVVVLAVTWTAAVPPDVGRYGATTVRRRTAASYCAEQAMQ